MKRITTRWLQIQRLLDRVALTSHTKASLQNKSARFVAAAVKESANRTHPLLIPGIQRSLAFYCLLWATYHVKMQATALSHLAWRNFFRGYSRGYSSKENDGNTFLQSHNKKWNEAVVSLLLIQSPHQGKNAVSILTLIQRIERPE